MTYKGQSYKCDVGWTVSAFSTQCKIGFPYKIRSAL